MEEKKKKPSCKRLLKLSGSHACRKAIPKRERNHNKLGRDVEKGIRNQIKGREKAEKGVLVLLRVFSA